MKRYLLLLLFAANLQTVYCQQPVTPAFVTSVEGVKEYTLPNGLRILLVPDAGISNIIINVVYGVGSRNEGYGETGMAHLLEHMLFRPSKKFTSIKQTIADKGASANGSTWYDRTDYFEILPAADSNLSWALDMESDRMVNSIMSGEDLKKEFSVVRNEFESGENNPDGVLTERVISTMYLWHNYGKSTIGSKEDIERVPIESLLAFYQKYYQPDNATLIVGGNFEEKKVLGLIGKYFAPIKKPSRMLQQPYTVEPAQDGQRYVELRRNGDVQYIDLGYHTPSASDPDNAGNAAVVDILTNDPSGIFYKTLVDTKLATRVSGSNYMLYDPGFSIYSATVPLGQSLDSTKAAFLSAASGIPSVTISSEALERAKNAILKALDNSQNNTVNFCIDLAEYIAAGDWRLFYLYRDRVKALSPQDIQRVMKKYYLPSNLTVGVFIPDKNAKDARVSVLPTPDIHALVKDYNGNPDFVQTAGFAATIPNIKTNTVYGRLSNGMQYALLKKPAKGNKIYAQMILAMGSEKTFGGKSITARLTADMLKKGTTTKSKKDINDLLDKTKTTIDVYPDNAAVYIAMNTDKENLSAALDLVTDLLLHPVFDAVEFEKTKLEFKTELENARSEPQSVAFTELNRKMNPYPKGHPFYVETIEEQLASLAKLTADSLKSFHNNFYGANHGYFSIVGNIEPAVVKIDLEKSFARFNSKQPYAEIEVKCFDVKGSRASMEINDKTNAFLIGRINVPLKQDDPEFVKLDIANEMIGGGTFLSSRLPMRLRETDGMSYGAGSWMQADYKYAASGWSVYAIFNPIYKNRLDSAVDQEMAKAIKTGFGEDEFRKCLSSWLTDRRTQLSDDRTLANMLSNYMYEGKTLDFYVNYENKAKALKLEDVNAVMRKYLSSDKITMVYAGAFEKK